MKHKFSVSLTLALVLAMLVTAVAVADNLKDDANSSGNNTFMAGQSTVIKYWIQAQGTCDAADGSSATVTINVPVGVTANPSTLTFTACNTSNEGNPNNTQNVTFSSSTPGNYSITASVTDTTGSYNTSPANFTLYVLAPPNTPPSISVTGVTDGASYNKGSVPAAGCSATDAEDGNSTFAATLGAITGPYASDGIGSQTASCSYTDAGGLTASASATYSIIDPTPPSITYVLNPAAPDGNNGWYKSNVTLTWTVTEDESPSSLSKTGCIDQSIIADQAETTYSCAASSAGGSAAQVDVFIKRDATAPTITFVGPSTSSWYNTDVTANWSCSDALSGAVSPSASATTSGEGNVQPAIGTCSDNAGNTASDTQSFLVDKTAPVVAVTGVANGATYTLGSVPAAGCSTTDALSGVATNASLNVNGGPVGSVTATCSGAWDNAGNAGNTASATYSIIYNWTGFFRPVDNMPTLNQAKSGSAIPVKFSLSGNQGLSIFAAGYPKSQGIACDTTVLVDGIEETVTAGGSSLSYDPLVDQYVYVWKTDKSWAGTCRQLVVKLIDGTYHYASFKFTK